MSVSSSDAIVLFLTWRSENYNFIPDLTHTVPQVVSTTLDILLNLARLEETRDAVANVVDLLPDLLQAMLVYRDNGKDIFPKCCAVLQTLAVCPKVNHLLLLRHAHLFPV